MTRYLPILAAVVLAGPAALAQRPGQARCSVNLAPAKSCAVTFTVDQRGMTHMTFLGANLRMSFIGRSQSGWWAGRLNGKPAMGYERNRGNATLSTYDLSTRFEWWYPANAHGTY